MKQVIVNAREFEAALKTASAAVDRGSPIAMLEQVCMSVSNGVCRLTGTDLTRWVEIKVSVKCAEEDFVAIFWDTSKILKACKYYKGDLKISYQDGKEQPLTFTSGDLQMACEIIEGEYPTKPSEDALQSYTVVASDLYKRTEKLKYAVSTNDARPILKGVQFRDNVLFCVDGQRMAASLMDNLCVKRPVSIPVPAMVQLSIFGDEPVVFSTGIRYAKFSNDSATVVVRLLEGEVMSPDKVVPQSFRFQYPIELAECIQRIKYLRDAAGKSAHHAEFLEGTLKIETLHGNYSARLPMDCNPGTNFAIDPQYLLEGMSQFKDAKTVELRTNDNPMSAIVVADGGDSYAFILPRRLKEKTEAA